MSADAGQGGLFDVEALAPLRNAGRAEAGTMLALQAAVREGLVRDVDGILVAAVLIAARALDRAEALPDKTAVYAIAQVLPQLQKAAHGLGLPLEPAPVGGARLPEPAPGTGDGPPSWLRDSFGPT